MPWSSLPEHLNSSEKWAGTDDDRWWMRWRLQIKGWFAYGPRAKEDWARWREWPLTLFKLGGIGNWRYEDDIEAYSDKIIPSYLSRIQYWKTWHFQLQWPFFIACHFKINSKLVYFYFGASRDADKVYWFPSAFIGTTWK